MWTLLTVKSVVCGGSRSARDSVRPVNFFTFERDAGGVVTEAVTSQRLRSRQVTRQNT
jgi:hypothetical protein